ncbi:transporter substrate-binding domain-containing protein [uncultured Arcobacter sp.]|uniref:transporter substrate-binding domain-containing protein n=1 Tax=uncultured Arcobacter sp. TaxID=165434 RepID=UPI00262DF6DD|nr:transporter substrate-binding domain-containing protein [uncultured Arcobacter sp.]
MKNIILLIVLLFINNSLFSKELILTKEEKNYLKNNPVLTAGYSTDFESLYNKDGVEGTVNGIIPDLYSLVSSKLNIKINFRTNTWDKTIKDAQDGKIDFIPLMAPNTAKNNKLLITDPIYTHLLGVFGKKELTINSIEDLNNLRVVYVENIKFLDNYLKRYNEQFKLIKVKSTFEAFEKVINNKADVLIAFHNDGNYLIKKHFLNNVKPLYLLNDLQTESVAASSNKTLQSILTKTLNSITYEDKINIVNNVTNYQHSSILSSIENRYIQENKFTIYYNVKGWLPFIFNENNILKGIAVDFWDEIAKSSGISAKYFPVDTFSESLKLFKQNPTSLLTATSSTKEREKYASFSKPYVSFPIGIATNIKEDFLIDLKKLEGKTVAVGKNYSAHKLLEKYFPKINFVPVENIQTALNLLANGKVYAVADILPVLNYELNRNSFTNLKISGTSKFNFDVQIMVNKENKELVPILNKLIDNLDENKKQEIINKWLHNTKFEKVDYTFIYIVGVLFIIIIFFMLFRQSILTRQKKAIEQEVKRATEKLKELNRIYEDTQKLAKIATIKKDMITGEYWVSNEFYNIFEISSSVKIDPDIIISKIYDKDKNKIKEFIERNEVFKGKSNNKDNISIRLNSEKIGIRYIDIFLSVIFDNNKNPIERRATVQDISDKILVEKESEKQKTILIQQSKLASMGEMIGAIAHQWRQPLNELTIRIQKLKYKYKNEEIDEKYVNEYVEKNKKTIDFMSKTIDDFRNFFRIDKIKKEFHIKESIDDVLNILGSQLKNHFIEVNYNENDFVYNGFKTEFQQVLINLINNSKDAFISNKTKEPKIDIIVENNRLILRDNAGGIPKDIIERVFEPYFTTKEQGEGTGIGMYMSKMIIEDNMNGKITLKNIDNGLEVYIEFGI